MTMQDYNDTKQAAQQAVRPAIETLQKVYTDLTDYLFENDTLQPLQRDVIKAEQTALKTVLLTLNHYYTL